MIFKKLILFGNIFVATSCGLDENFCELNRPELEMLDRAKELYVRALLSNVFHVREFIFV